MNVCFKMGNCDVYVNNDYKNYYEYNKCLWYKLRKNLSRSVGKIKKQIMVFRDLRKVLQKGKL